MDDNTASIEVGGIAISAADYLKLIVQKPLSTFEELTSWKHSDYLEFKKLLDILKESNGAECIKTTEKGIALEELVKFIIKKTYFYKVYGNVTTGTNEIDQVVILSDEGKQALEQFRISRDIIPIYSDLFLCECKNYKSSLGVTWVGKFYGLLNSCNCDFGIIFSTKGLTGKEENWNYSYGLIRVFNMIEKYKNDRIFNIIEFNLDDYEKIATGISFFKLVESKIHAMKLATQHDQLLDDNKHESVESIKKIISQLS